MAWLNGVPVTVDELLPLALTNYGTFTSFRVDESRRVRGLELHLERLRVDSQTLFSVEISPERVRTWIRAALAAAQAPSSIRITIYDPDLGLGAMGARATPQTLITVGAAPAIPVPPLAVKSDVFTRDYAELKHVGLWSQLHRRRVAMAGGFDDVVFVEQNGCISEGSTWNVGFVDEFGGVVWPEGDVLPGVTMRLLDQSYPGCRRAKVSLIRSGEMTAAFAANASVGVRAISRIDDQNFDVQHPTLGALRAAYAQIPCDEV